MRQTRLWIAALSTCLCVNATLGATPTSGAVAPSAAAPAPLSAVPTRLAPLPDDPGHLELHFIDVGQGDCTLIKRPNGTVILVDCGSLGGANETEVREYLLDQLDSQDPTIDALVITHPDRDHYNLLPDVLEGVAVQKTLLVGQPSEHSSGNTDDWIDDLPNRQILSSTYFDPEDQPNQLFADGESKIHVLAANIQASASAKNARSIVLMVSYGTYDAILTGDATFDTEEAIVDRYDDEWLDVELLKVGHHGSSTTSTSKDWLKVVRPETAVVSAGYWNSFGHPRRSVIYLLYPYTEKTSTHTMRYGWYAGNREYHYRDMHYSRESIYSTASSGTIVVHTDGSEWWMTFGDNP